MLRTMLVYGEWLDYDGYIVLMPMFKGALPSPHIIHARQVGKGFLSVDAEPVDKEAPEYVSLKERFDSHDWYTDVFSLDVDTYNDIYIQCQAIASNKKGALDKYSVTC